MLLLACKFKGLRFRELMEVYSEGNREKAETEWPDLPPLFAREMVGMFNSDADVLSYGAMLIRLITPFYVLCCANQVYAGALRGAGAVKAPMYIMLGSFVLFRQVYLFAVSKIANTITWVALGYPFGWIVATVASLIYYYFGNWEKKCGLKNIRMEEKTA